MASLLLLSVDAVRQFFAEWTALVALWMLCFVKPAEKSGLFVCV